MFHWYHRLCPPHLPGSWWNSEKFKHFKIPTLLLVVRIYQRQKSIASLLNEWFIDRTVVTIYLRVCLLPEVGRQVGKYFTLFEKSLSRLARLATLIDINKVNKYKHERSLETVLHLICTWSVCLEICPHEIHSPDHWSNIPLERPRHDPPSITDWRIRILSS